MNFAIPAGGELEHRIQNHAGRDTDANVVTARTPGRSSLSAGLPSIPVVGLLTLLVLYLPRQTNQPEHDRIHPTVGKVALEEREELRVRPD